MIAENQSRYIKPAVISVAVLLVFFTVWPFHSVPTGNRGVVTAFGKIVSIEDEGLVILPPGKNSLSSVSVPNGPTSKTPKAARRTRNRSRSA